LRELLNNSRFSTQDGVTYNFEIEIDYKNKLSALFPTGNFNFDKVFGAVKPFVPKARIDHDMRSETQQILFPQTVEELMRGNIGGQFWTAFMYDMTGEVFSSASEMLSRKFLLEKLEYKREFLVNYVNKLGKKLERPVSSSDLTRLFFSVLGYECEVVYGEEANQYFLEGREIELGSKFSLYTPFVNGLTKWNFEVDRKGVLFEVEYTRKSDEFYARLYSFVIAAARQIDDGKSLSLEVCEGFPDIGGRLMWNYYLSAPFFAMKILNFNSSSKEITSNLRFRIEYLLHKWQGAKNPPFGCFKRGLVKFCDTSGPGKQVSLSSCEPWGD